MRKYFLESERIGFGVWDSKDLELARKLWGNRQVTEYISGKGYVSEEEIQKLVDYTISQQKAIYDESLTVDKTSGSSSVSNEADGYASEEEYDDPIYNEVVDFAVSSGKISASLVQRRFRLGYNRAARIIDLLEERGIIGPQNGSKPREVLLGRDGGGEEE